ncbi:MAG: DUF1800 family protein [Pseudomonadota bacterium]
MAEAQDFSGFELNEAAAPDSAPASLGVSTVAPALALALAACDSAGGSSGGGGIVSPAPTPTPTIAAVTQVQASRFLAQATMGASRLDIAEVQSRGFEGWITAQFAMTRATSHWDWLVSKGYNNAANINNEQGFDPTMWRQLIAEPGQLRQRVGMALLETLVVGISGVQLNWVQFAMAAYVDVLLDNAFGNFRTILDRITTNAAMGSFLTFLNNRKANAATGSVPDENYARELMQLFTIGLHQLNMDGTPKLSGGKPIETYGPADVSGLARVFTGLTTDTRDTTTPDVYRRPLVVNAATHELGASNFLGASVASGTTGAAAIGIALDTIFAHANVPPFVSKQLIQRLVTSNPTPAYVGRVASVFADNGAGVRGDMKAVIRAILLDGEARADPSSATTAGKLREPVMRMTGWARAFNAASISDAWAIGDTSSSSTRLAQCMGRSSSVFNFFRPGYSPPNTAISNAGLVAPEFQITNELSAVAFINYMSALITATGDFRADYTEILTKAADSQALVDDVNLVVAAGQVSAATVAQIKAAVDSIGTTGTGPANRVSAAILLTLASPEYLTLK